MRVTSAPDGTPVLEPLTFDRMRYEQERAAHWYVEKNDKCVKCQPPERVIKDMLACPTPPLPELRRVVRTPVITQDGSILSKPGFDEVGGVLYVPLCGFELPRIPKRPSRKQIQAALRLLREELVVDFPFKTIADLAHALGLLLQPFLRECIIGPTPLHVIGKPTPGTGADLLAESLLMPATGTALSPTTVGASEIETKRTLTAILSTSPTVVLFDNITHLDSASLAAAITADYWLDRNIGTSQTLRPPVRCAWIATGNNPSLSKELARRAVQIWLDADMERPWERTGFRHPNQRLWIRENLAALTAGVLTLVRV